MLTLYGIPRAPKTEVSMTHTTLGMLGELTVAQILQRYDFDTRVPSTHQSGDLIASLTTPLYVAHRKIEVKTAKRGARGTFQFCLRRLGSNGYAKTDHRDSDLLVLLCVEDDFSVVGFCIPAHDVSVKKIEFKNPLLCKYRQWIMWQ